MRLKTLNAANMTQAMALLRRELGDDAIIVSTETTPQGVRIVVAIEEPDALLTNPGAVQFDMPRRESHDDEPHDETGTDAIDVVHDALDGHGMPNPLIERLVDASFLAGTDEPLAALAGALTQVFAFQPLVERGPVQPIMLVGPPGAGKTLTVAKLAARAMLARRKVRLITTDAVRAGAVEQLHAYARVLSLPFAVAETDRELAALAAAAQPDELVLIDTAGINPWAPRDVAELEALVRAVSAEPILVLAAGGDVIDAIELTRAFTLFGVTRLIATRLDMARRLGGLLAAADAGGLALADYGNTPSVANGLAPFEPISLAKMLMPSSNSAQSAASAPAIQAATRGLRS